MNIFQMIRDGYFGQRLRARETNPNQAASITTSKKENHADSLAQGITLSIEALIWLEEQKERDAIKAAVETGGFSDLAPMSCDQLGDELRGFMAFGFSNESIASKSFGEVAAYAPFPSRVELIQTERIHQFFVYKGCGQTSKQEVKNTMNPPREDYDQRVEGVFFGGK